MCIRVVLYHRNIGLPAAWVASMKSSALVVTSSSMVSIRLRVSGPVSVHFWLPHAPKRGSGASVSASVATQCEHAARAEGRLEASASCPG